MPIVGQQDLIGSTLAQYDEAIAQMGIPAGGPHIAPRLLFHFVIATDDGFQVTDVRTSRQGFERSAEENIIPVTQALGVAPPPNVKIIETHNYNTAG